VVMGGVNERKELYVNSFSGLNIATDSIDIKPEEAIDLTNFVLDKFGALHKRYGYKNWNDSLISTGHIKDIHYVEDKNGSKWLYVASGNYVYKESTWTDLNNAWSGKELSYSDGSIDTAVSGQKYVYGLNTSWILATDIGDKLILGANTYTIDSILADTCLHISANVTTGFGGTYRIIKYIKGDPQLSSWNGNLYVCDSKGEPFWYDGARPYLLGIVDSGFVDSLQATDSTKVIFSRGNLILQSHSNIVRDGNVGWDISDSVLVGDIFNLYVTRGAQDVSWSATITGFHLGGLRLTHSIPECLKVNPFQDICNFDGPCPDTVGETTTRWEIVPKNYQYSTENATFFSDTSKNWIMDSYIGFYCISGKNARAFSFIKSNTENLLYIDSTSTLRFQTGNKYYIVSQIPEMRNPIKHIPYYNGNYPNPFDFPDSTWIPRDYFKYVYFFQNRMYAIGYTVAPKSIGQTVLGDTINTGRVWYSDIAWPVYRPADFNFDVSGAKSGVNVSLYSADACQSLFELRGNLYIATNTSVYRLLGDPTEIAILNQITKGIGTNQPNGITVSKDNIAFIMNRDGIWTFDGNSTDKIWAIDASSINKGSQKIDPLIEKYRNCSMVAGQFKDNMFFSYPESSITVVMYYPVKEFTTWNIGMQSINSQSIAIDSGYFLFSKYENSAYIYRYPRADLKFHDEYGGDSTNHSYLTTYTTGWMTFGGLKYSKIIKNLDILCDFYGATISLYTDLDGDSAVWDTTSAVSYAKGIRRFIPIGSDDEIWGDFFKLKITSDISADFSINGIRYEIMESGPK